MEVYVANSSPLFETLNAVYSSAFNTWSRLKSHSYCLSDSAIIKPDHSQQMSYYVRRILYNIWEFIMIHLSCQSFRSTGYHTTSCTLPLPSFQELNSKSKIVYNIANPYCIYFTSKFRKSFFIQNISVVVCFEVSPRPFGYPVTHDCWQEIRH